MSFQQFAKDQFIKTFETGETVRMGSFKVVNSGELENIRVLAYVRGTLSGTEKIRVKVYADSGYNSLLSSSDWAILPYSNWIGKIRLDFAQFPINKNLTYYIACEIGDYTANYPTLEVGLAHDFPYPIYATGATLFYETNLSFEIFLRRAL